MFFNGNKPRTVESITSKLHDTVAELERHADDQLQKAGWQKERAVEAEALHEAHKTEHQLANAVASNIRALLEP